MASLQHIKTGWQTGYRLRVCTGGRRHSVWLGPVREREAQAIKLHVEAVVQSQRLRTPLPSETVRWLAQLQGELRGRLREVLGVSKTVDEAVELYIDHEEKTNKPTTARGKADTLDQFAHQYGTEFVRSITTEQIDTWLCRQNVAESTLGKHVKHLRSWLAWCHENQLVDIVPKISLASTIGAGEKAFIDFGQFQRVIDHFTGDPEMQAILALSRWCGLRIASEVVELRRSCVLLDMDRINITDSKRTYRQSRGPPRVRQLPLFEGLRPYLVALLALPGKPHDYLLPTYGGQSAERVGSLLRQRVYRAIDLLGLERWPRVFHSLRATRQTQLKEMFGEKAACEWIGNSEEVFRKNYELIDDQTFAQAVKS